MCFSCSSSCLLVVEVFARKRTTEPVGSHTYSGLRRHLYETKYKMGLIVVESLADAFKEGLHNTPVHPLATRKFAFQPSLSTIHKFARQKHYSELLREPHSIQHPCMIDTGVVALAERYDLRRQRTNPTALRGEWLQHRLSREVALTANSGHLPYTLGERSPPTDPGIGGVPLM